MAEERFLSPSNQEINIEDIIQQARHRWLRPQEICDILRNYERYNLTPNPVAPHKPESGTLFLFDRKTLRYFRKDGHNWRKKKDGKTTREAHERLKVGKVNALHCYYAHGEDNAEFQRRSYWLLEGPHDHIVLVHYLEANLGPRSSIYRSLQEKEENRLKELSNSPDLATHSESPETGCSASDELNGIHALEFDNLDDNEGFELGDPGFDSFLDELETDNLLENFDLMPSNADGYEGQQAMISPIAPSEDYGTESQRWREILEELGELHRPPIANESKEAQLSILVEDHFKSNNPIYIGQDIQPQTDLPWLKASEIAVQTIPQYEAVCNLQQIPLAVNLLDQPGNNMFPDHWTKIAEQAHTTQEIGHSDSNGGLQLLNGSNTVSTSASECGRSGKWNTFSRKDSFQSWAMKEFGGSNGNLDVSTSNSGNPWSEDEGTTEVTSKYGEGLHVGIDESLTVSQEQQFSITAFAPSWSFVRNTTMVLVSGKFLKSVNDPSAHRWCCMFGEIEVPAKLIGPGVLTCETPQHNAGVVQFYVTCGDRTACSEIREFEFREGHTLVQESELPEKDVQSKAPEELLIQIRFVEMLVTANLRLTSQRKEGFGDVIQALEKVKEEVTSKVFSKEHIAERLLKVMLEWCLHWFLSAIDPEGKDACMLDAHGQGLLHMAAALGYDWALNPIMNSGVGVDFRDNKGWTALHWAAYFGRESCVLKLLSSGATPGCVTDPTPSNPTGLTSSDLATDSGHTGLAAFLAETLLTHHLNVLTLKDDDINELHFSSAAIAAEEAVECLTGNSDPQHLIKEKENSTLLRRTLSAVRKAAVTEALINAKFRQYSLHRRLLKEQEAINTDELSCEHIEDIIREQYAKTALSKKLHTSATKVQSRFRGWKARKSFLHTRQQVIKIQACIRGYQARKHYKKILWSVGILEKGILRWQRKRIGLRGFQIDLEKMSIDDGSEDDFLKEGRKQKEKTFKAAVGSVQAMVYSVEAQEQYHRLAQGSQQEATTSTGAELLIQNQYVNQVLDPGPAEDDFMS